MKENRYDDPLFFQKYSESAPLQLGLQGAGEWSELERLLPDFRGQAGARPGLRLRLALQVCRRAWGRPGAGNRPLGKNAGDSPAEEQRRRHLLPALCHGGPGPSGGQF